MDSLNQGLNASENLPLSKCSLLSSPGSWQQLNPGVPFSPQQSLLIKAACQINPLWPWGEGGDGFSKLWAPLAEGGFPTPFVAVQHLRRVFQAGIWPWEVGVTGHRRGENKWAAKSHGEFSVQRGLWVFPSQALVASTVQLLCDPTGNGGTGGCQGQLWKSETHLHRRQTSRSTRNFWSFCS